MHFLAKYVLLFPILSTLPAVEETKDILVTTKNGKVRGKILPTPTSNMYAFQGIPYAVPPLGNLRFQATQPIKNWTGVLDATQEGKSCIGDDYLSNQGNQSEDCLYVNIYTPTLKSSAQLPVIAFIHGGRYIAMSGNIEYFGPGYLIDQDVIVATFNYRLGPYGFLGTEDMVVPGNAGLKDQVLALKWIQQNIKYFGGDPSKITLMGQSAGGSACGLHILSKLSKGLFRAAYCISGSALTPWSVFNSPRNYTYILANILNNTITKDTKANEVVGFLSKQSPAEIIKASGIIKTLPTLEKEDNRLAPCIEPDHPDAFLTDKPYELMKTGDFNRVPLLMGINSEEALAFVPDIATAKSEGQRLDSEQDYIFPYNFTPKADASKKEIHDFLKQIYIKENEKFIDNLEEVVKFKSDEMFNRGTIKHALMQSEFADVYFYEFSYSGNLARRQIPFPGMQGKCGHGDDLRYTLIRGTNYNATEQDLLTIKRMTTMVANFAKYLNPTPEKSDLLQNLTWPKLKYEGLRYVNISQNLEIARDCKGETFHKWSHAIYEWAQRPLRSF